MKLILDPLFASKYRKGYLRTSKDGRKRVDLVNNKIDRTTISYARYLVSIREKRFLTPDEEVDHNDTDKTNDDLNNLILRTVSDHLIKTLSERKPQTILEFICPVCQNSFTRIKGREGVNRIPKCSRRCNGIASKRIQMENKQR